MNALSLPQDKAEQNRVSDKQTGRLKNEKYFQTASVLEAFKRPRRLFSGVEEIYIKTQKQGLNLPFAALFCLLFIWKMLRLLYMHNISFF